MMEQSQTKIRVEELVKIFGETPKVGLRLFREGHDRESILAKTGNVLGVAGVSFEICQGELFVIMGLSGSGKSTLIRCLNRLIEPTSGNIYVDGEDVAHVSADRLRELRRTKMAMVFQKFALFPHMTVAENAEYGLKVTGLGDRERRQKALETLEIVGLAQWADRFPAELSGGMQQRVGLARALATDPDILLMDEAFSALDPLIRRDMQAELVRLQAELHKTIVFISHDIHEALKIGDRVAVMRAGRFEQVGTPEELIARPANDYIRDFMLDINRIQVLKVGSVARAAEALPQEASSVMALERLQAEGQAHLYVVDSDRRPVGLAGALTLQAAIAAGQTDLQEAMARDFLCVPADAPIETAIPLCQKGMPLAVVDAGGKFIGIIEPTDILASMA